MKTKENIPSLELAKQTNARKLKVTLIHLRIWFVERAEERGGGGGRAGATKANLKLLCWEASSSDRHVTQMEWNPFIWGSPAHVYKHSQSLAVVTSHLTYFFAFRYGLHFFPFRQLIISLALACPVKYPPWTNPIHSELVLSPAKKRLPSRPAMFS